MYKIRWETLVFSLLEEQSLEPALGGKETSEIGSRDPGRQIVHKKPLGRSAAVVPARLNGHPRRWRLAALLRLNLEESGLVVDRRSKMYILWQMILLMTAYFPSSQSFLDLFWSL